MLKIAKAAIRCQGHEDNLLVVTGVSVAVADDERCPKSEVVNENVRDLNRHEDENCLIEVAGAPESVGEVQ